MKVDPTDLSVEELEALLTRARVARQMAAQDLRDETVPVWTYGLHPAEDSYRDLYPGSGLLMYRLEGHVENIDECREAGHTLDSHGRGMTYIYNPAVCRIAGDSGGGTVFIGFRSEGEAHLEAVDYLGKFIAEHPAGGDVTDIVEAYEKHAADLRESR